MSGPRGAGPRSRSPGLASRARPPSISARPRQASGQLRRSITATSPAGSAGSVDVTVTTPRRNIAHERADELPTTRYRPSPASARRRPAGRRHLRHDQRHRLRRSDRSQLRFNAATSFTVKSDTSITATYPAGSSGTVDVTVTTPGGTSATSSADHSPTPRSTVTGSPRPRPAAGGTSVTITGTGFTGATAVKFGATPRRFTVSSATSDQRHLPGRNPGPVDITVTTPVATPRHRRRPVHLLPDPTVTSVSPTAGPLAGGTYVTITGTGFTGATAVKFGSTAATSFTVKSDTRSPRPHRPAAPARSTSPSPPRRNVRH